MQRNKQNKHKQSSSDKYSYNKDEVFDVPDDGTRVPRWATLLPVYRGVLETEKKVTSQKDDLSSWESV